MIRGIAAFLHAFPSHIYQHFSFLFFSLFEIRRFLYYFSSREASRYYRFHAIFCFFMPPPLLPGCFFSCFSLRQMTPLLLMMKRYFSFSETDAPSLFSRFFTPPPSFLFARAAAFFLFFSFLLMPPFLDAFLFLLYCFFF